MREKSFTLLAILAFCFTGLFAQNEKKELIEFENTSKDFGTLKKGTPTEHVFKFTNTSKEVVKLTTVKASCGCTTPSWSKEEIQPGATGEIKVKYDSNRIGPFNKNVRVMYNDTLGPIMLFIKGKIDDVPVEQNPEEKKVEEQPQSNINYVIPRGAVSFEKMIENLKSLTSEEVKVVEFRYKNVSDRVVNILADKTETDAEFSVEFKDKQLKPGQESLMRVTVDGTKMKKNERPDGYISSRVVIYTDEVADPRKQVSINLSYTRVLSPEEKANSPTISFETIEVDGGKIIEGEQFVYDFKFKNTGQAPLKINGAKASCGCTATTPPVEEIQPGQESAITATFNSKGRVGKQSKTITVTSNDVEHPTIVLKFSVEVVKDPFHAGSMMGDQ